MSTEQLPDDFMPSSATVSPSLEPRRVDELWFHDGTLVLTTDTLLFRIYGGLLAKESPIFHDMLELPQPQDGEAIDGCPVVKVYDDSRDVEYFLRALFDYKFFLSYPNPTNFEIITSILRLSKKYEVDSLHKCALAHLASGFPLTAVDYPPSPSWDMAGQDIRAILFAREQGLDWVLPTAFYRVCAYNSIDEILNGIYVDNTRVELDPKDKLACLEQYVLLRGAASAEMVNFLWDPEKICASERCRAERLGRRKAAERARAGGHLPLELWMDADWHALQKYVCGGCLTTMRTAHYTSLEQFWDGLPQRFGVAAWGELKEMKSNALLAD